MCFSLCVCVCVSFSLSNFGIRQHQQKKSGEKRSYLLLVLFLVGKSGPISVFPVVVKLHPSKIVRSKPNQIFLAYLFVLKWTQWSGIFFWPDFMILSNICLFFLSFFLLSCQANAKITNKQFEPTKFISNEIAWNKNFENN